jgi:hypothetical protein
MISRSPANDKQGFGKEEKITLAALRYSGRSSVNGISGLLSCQSFHISVFRGSRRFVEALG